MHHHRFLLLSLFSLFTIVVSSVFLVGFLTPHKSAHAASPPTVGPEPTWSLPFPNGTQAYIGPLGLHDHNFFAVTDDTSHTSYSLGNSGHGNPNDPKAQVSLDIVPLDASHPVLPLANGTVLAVQKYCHIVIIDNGNGWWSVYLHLAPIKVQSGDAVTVNTVLGFPNTSDPLHCGETSSAPHVHIALINSTGATTGDYITLKDRMLCGYQVVEQNNDLTNIILQGLTTVKDQVFTIPNCSSSSFSVVPTPNLGTYSNDFHGVATITQNNVWAVGVSFDQNGNAQGAFTEHWNGKAWRVIPSPQPGGQDYLNAIASVPGTNQLWAVGSYRNNLGIYQTLVEHWNGSAWKVVSSPNVGTGSNSLDGVAAVSANDIWAVGSAVAPLIEHWNGSKWSIVPSPNPISPNSVLSGISAVSSNDIWAVGSYLDSTSSLDQTLTEHWDGTGWTIIPSPNTGSGINILRSVAAVSANDIWAVGQGCSTNCPSGGPPANFIPLIEHWDGSTWSVVSSPNGGLGGASALSAVSVTSATSVWAVGGADDSNFQTHALIEHWDGSTWSIIPSPNVGTNNDLFGVATVSTQTVWAVGTIGIPGQTCAEFEG